MHIFSFSSPCFNFLSYSQILLIILFFFVCYYSYATNQASLPMYCICLNESKPFYIQISYQMNIYGLFISFLIELAFEDYRNLVTEYASKIQRGEFGEEQTSL